MKVGVLTVLLGDQPLEDAVEYLDEIGVEAVELGCGGYVGDDHLPTQDVLDDEDAQSELLALLDDHGMDLAALATHNNPIHPDEDQAEADDAQFRDAIALAGQLGVDTVVNFSGLPGGSPTAQVPNWITAPWPPDHAEALEYQWEVAIDYWSEIAPLAEEHGVDIAVEMHPNMLVHEPHGLLSLREATNERIGANFDPSHLYWQDISITDAIRLLGEHDAIHHFHAKDTKVYEEQARTRGVLDTQSYGDVADRAWIFRSVGYGHGEQHWKDVVSTLRMVGYDGVLSIEHEDALASPTEGLEKAVDVLKRARFVETPGDAYWA
ncbi:MAG: sugar phosphate isomerase/epimerase [Natronomonas sp.]|uniref:sugar phosphate isomerase/epimerase family protein n=1 Tax=Natronomonas sp. TaxID=2184060 RepID=UPI00286FB8F0|nr:sugar phosphate isomerase/epimerase [Natronomonas sp.]MDR9430586.1 sugar phosphate isomerase/epimerase [Natronomonas sp.]